MHRFIIRYPKHILALSVLLTLLCVFLVSRLTLDLNLLALLPKKDPRVGVFLDLAEQVWVHSLLVAVVEPPEGMAQGAREAFVQKLAEGYAGSPRVQEVTCKGGEAPLADMFRTFLPYASLFLTVDDLKKVARRLSDPEIRKRVRENKRLLTTPLGTAAEEFLGADPLGLAEILTGRFAVPSHSRPAMGRPGYYRSEAGDTYFIFIRPGHPPQDVAFSRALMAELRLLEREAAGSFFKESGIPSKQLRVSFAGGHAIAVSDEATTKQDIRTTLLTSFFGVMILFGLSFKKIRVLPLVGIPLGFSLLWTLGLASLVFGRLNILSCIFSCVLIGLGIDFAIHVVNRYFGPEKETLNAPERLRDTFREAGTGIVIGGITTAAAFYAVGISDFGGFRQLGILTGTGILFCLAAMLVVLPALLVLAGDKGGPRRHRAVAGYGLGTLMAWIFGRPKRVLAAVLLVTCLLATTGVRSRFDDNLRNFRPADDRTFELQERITQWMGGSTGQILLVAEGPSEAAVMETNAALTEGLEELKAAGSIAGAMSVSRYLLSPSRQEPGRAFIRTHGKAFDINRVKRTFEEALEENGFNRTAYDEAYFDILSGAFGTSSPVLPSTLFGTGAGEALERFLFRKGDTFRIVNYVVPSKDLWTRAETDAFMETVRQKMGEKGVHRNRYVITGTQVLTGELKGLIFENMWSALWIAGGSICGILLVYYRNMKLVLFSALPLLSGLALLSGLMVLFGQDFNFFNLIVIPMIAGIGIDDGVHLTNTYRQVGGGALPEALGQTGRAVVLTSLTTLVGFGSISLSHYPGLRSMGYVAVIGVGACLLASLILLPALFALMRKRPP